MAYSDPSDKILKWENGDVVTPLAAKMNMHLDSVGLVTNKITRDGVYKVLNIPERTALVNAIGTTNISAANPLLVWRANATAGQRLEYTENGGNWHYVKTSQDVDDTGWVNCTILPGFEPRPNFIPAVRRKGNMVVFKGSMNPTGITSGTSSVIAQLPAGYLPTTEQRWIGFRTGEASQPFGGWITAQGAITIQTPNNRTLGQFPTQHFSLITGPWFID